MNDKAYKFSTRDSTEFTVGDESRLPEVTSEDNGDVLTVVDGAWAKAAPSSGGVMVVHGTVDDEDILTLDKTWQEIYDAFSTSSVLLRIEHDDEFSLAVVLEVSFFQDQGEDVYQVTTLNLSFECSSASEYPKSSGGR